MELDTSTYTDEVMESLASRVNALREIGWDQLGSGGAASELEIGISDVHQMANILRPMAQSHPLHIRGAQLRHAYTFGRGINISGTTPAADKVIKDPRNQQVLFSVDAQERLNIEAFVTGNIFLFRHRRTNRMVLVPAEEITSVYTDDFDTSELKYVARSWSHEGKQTEQVFPLAGVTSPKARLDNKQVNKEWVVYHKASKSFAGQPLGIPDSFGGALWSVAYSKYLSDSATLTHILKQIAWRITKAQSTAQAQGSALQMTDPKSQGQIGGTASLAGDMNLQSVGVPSSQVDFNNGQPLAAMVATAFGVPVIALIASPGATGGSYGAATTLDMPTMKGFEAVQDSWTLFYETILRDLVPKTKQDDVAVTFPEIDKDPAYRAMTSLSLAYEGGAIWRDEYRTGALQLVGVPDMHDGKLPPKPKPETPAGQGGAVTPGQGKPGAVKGGMDQGQTNHDGDNDDK